MAFEQRIPKVSWITGVVHSGDAISETVLAELDALTALSHAQRRSFDARVYCTGSNVADTRVQVVAQWQTPLTDPHFQTSDIYIFHFGVYNDLHHLLNLIRRDAKVVVWFHNVTPPQYLPAGAENLTHESFRQIENFVVADHVLVNSQHTAQTLAQTGLQLPVQVFPLFGRNAEQLGVDDCAPEATAPGAAFQILSCGRFVKSKSLHTLLEALAIIDSRPDMAAIKLTMAGLREHSDEEYISRLQNMVTGLSPRTRCRFAFDLPRDAIHKLYRESDLFVLPSLHEGFGMPVVEALAAGLPVVATRAGALAEVCSGLAMHFDTGNAQALADAIAQQIAQLQAGQVACEQGVLPLAEWRERALAKARVHARAAYVERFAGLIDGWLSSPRRLSKSRAEALEALHAGSGLYAQVAGQADAFEARIVAGLLHQDIQNTVDSDSNRALISLLRWPFPAAVQSEADLSYWRRQLIAVGLPGLIKHLAGSPDVRASAFALQTGASLLQCVQHAGQTAERAETAPMTAGPELPISVRLLTLAAMSDGDFVRECYRMILGREPEEGGLGAFFVALQRKAMSRDAVAQEIWASEEARLRRKAASA